MNRWDKTRDPDSRGRRNREVVKVLQMRIRLQSGLMTIMDIVYTYTLSLLGGRIRAAAVLRKAAEETADAMNGPDSAAGLKATLFRAIRRSVEEQRGAMNEGDRESRADRRPADSGEPDALAVAGAIRSLPMEEATVLVLADVLGMFYEDIGEFCGWSVGTIERRLHAARSLLHAQLFRRELIGGASPATCLSGDGTL